MNTKLGPVLLFDSATADQWNLRALFVFNAAGARLPTLTYHNGVASQTATAVTLLAQGAEVVCVYDLSFKRSARTAGRRYAIAGGKAQKTFVPGREESLHLGFASCAGFDDWKNKTAMDEEGRDPWALWKEMLAAHKQKPFHLLIQGGDQIYIDQLWVAHDSPMDQWRRLSRSKQKKAKWMAGGSLDQQAREGLMSIYCSNWCREAMAAVMATVPSLMMWDDHDICDGWGSHPDEVQECHVMRGLFGVAREYFQVFQLGRKPDAGPLVDAIGPGANGHFSSLKVLGDVGLLVLDLRSQRRRDRVLFDEAGWGQFFSELSARWPAATPPKHLLVVSSVPVIFISGPSDLAGLHPWDPVSDPQDDLIDHWSDYRHHTEREHLVRGLLQFSREKKVRVSIVSGDVHVGALGIITSERDEDRNNPGRVITQLISSAIVNASPGGLVLWAAQQLSGKDQVIYRDVTGELVPFGDGVPRLIPIRNWLSVRAVESPPGGLAAQWHFEGGRFAPTKLISAV
jgi:hypothetical protein